VTRRIAVVSSSRADFSHLFWVLHDLEAHPVIELRTIAFGPLLSSEFGRAVDEVERSGLRIDERVECLLSSDSDVGMAKTLGVATLGFAEVLDRMRPDLLLLIADRYEMLAPASVALTLRVPVAHIEGGELSEGAIDDAARHALTRLSHLHLTTTEAARARVLASGEEPWRVHRVGAASLDHLKRSELLGREELERRLGLQLGERCLLVGFHPLTIARDTLREAEALFTALDGLEAQLLFSFPNADAGSRELAARARALCDRRAETHLFHNLDPPTYWSLLRQVSAMLGNSSSGLMESPSLALPAVNVGQRQQGRELAANVIDVPADAEAIQEAVERALDPAFRAGLGDVTNPYGDGAAAERIVGILAEVPLGEKLIMKRGVEVTSGG
jgi:UDP-N-acetylglucosamine 2-epimerase (non-hydrolysing)/GDP/UDP-N,N'-diacetylbacillosamine 2-epimerase (hydrolysing)